MALCFALRESDIELLLTISLEYHVSFCKRKPAIWVFRLTRSDTNWAIQSQNQAKSLKVRFEKKRDCNIRTLNVGIPQGLRIAKRLVSKA